MLSSALSKSILMIDPTLSGAQIDFNRPQTVSYTLWYYCNLFFWVWKWGNNESKLWW